MILYNVTVQIDNNIQQDWLNWMMKTHIPEVLATGLFSGYKFLELVTRQEDETGFTYCIQYLMPSMNHYDTYQKDFAPALKQKAEDKFGGKFVAFRTVLQEVVL